MGFKATQQQIDEWEAKGLIEPSAKKLPWQMRPREKIVAVERWAATAEASNQGDIPYVCVTVPIRLPNPLNSGKGRSRHYWTRSREAEEQKRAINLALVGVLRSTWDELAKGCIVTMTRMSAGTLSEFDALPASLKHVRDVVAQHLFGGEIGRRDDDPRATWIPKQLRVPVRTFGVIISIRTRGANG